MTQKEKDQAIEKQALELGWNNARWRKSVWLNALTALREARADNREVYLLDEFMLSKIATWKKARKHFGGIKSRNTAAAKNLQKNS